MATFVVTSSNWNASAFWSSINAADGDVIDFSMLGPQFTVNFGHSGHLHITDGSSTYHIGNPGEPSSDVNINSGNLADFDTVIGSTGTAGDNLFFDDDDQNVTGGAGDDTISVQGSNDTVAGGLGDDSVNAGTGDDVVEGGVGDDTILGGTGNDVLSGDGVAEGNIDLGPGLVTTNLLYSSTDTGVLRSYDPATDTQTQIASGLQSYGDLAITPDGMLLGIPWSASADTIYRINPDTGAETPYLTISSGFHASLATNSQGDLFYTSDDPGSSTGMSLQVRSFNPDGSYGAETTVGELPWETTDIVFQSDTTMFAVANGGLFRLTLDETSTVQSTEDLGLINGQTDFWGLSFDEDGQLYAFEGSGEVWSTDPNTIPMTWTQEAGTSDSGGLVYGAAGTGDVSGNFTYDDVIDGGGGNDSIDGGQGDDLLYGDNRSEGDALVEAPPVDGADHTFVLWQLSDLNITNAPGNGDPFGNASTGESNVAGSTLEIGTSSEPVVIGLTDDDAQFSDGDSGQQLTETVSLIDGFGNPGDTVELEYSYSLQDPAGNIINIYAVELNGADMIGVVSDAPLSQDVEYTFVARTSTDPTIDYSNVASSYYVADDTSTNGDDTIDGGAGNDTIYGDSDPSTSIGVGAGEGGQLTVTIDSQAGAYNGSVLAEITGADGVVRVETLTTSYDANVGQTYTIDLDPGDSVRVGITANGSNPIWSTREDMVRDSNATANSVDLGFEDGGGGGDFGDVRLSASVTGDTVLRLPGGDALEPGGNGELITNGSFEGNMSGWTIVNPTGGQEANYSGSVRGVQVNSGNETAGGDGIEQTITTLAGETYSTSVEFAINGSTSSTHTALIEAIDADGNVLASETITVSTGNIVVAALSFEGAGGDTTIRITNPSSTNTVSSDLVIREVSVVGPVEGRTFSETDGNDSLSGGAGDDLIYGGGGDDTINAGDGADTVYAGDGDDTLEGGAGADVLDGGADTDTALYTGSGEGVDVSLERGTGIGGDAEGDTLTNIEGLEGSSFDDTLAGDSGSNTLSGGGGADSLSGGDGADSLSGGSGADTLSGGGPNDGADTLLGGDDADTFVNVGINDTIDGGAGGTDADVLNLTGSTSPGGSLEVIFTGPDSDGNGQDGIVKYFDSDGQLEGTLNFSNIETIVPCFTAGTLIATEHGLQRVEDIDVGTRVLTRDNGFQEVCWTGRRHLTQTDLEAQPALRPIKIATGALAPNVPCRDLIVSPQHRVLIQDPVMQLYFDTSEVLVAAAHLCHRAGFAPDTAPEATYNHIMFACHEIVLSNGLWTESFQPGAPVVSGMDKAQRDELLTLFPQLAGSQTEGVYPAARRSLKRHEAQILG